MSEIEKALKDEETDLINISDDERLMLVDVLAFVSHALKKEMIWFNKRGLKHNQQYIEFCQRMAKKFACMKVHQVS